MRKYILFVLVFLALLIAGIPFIAPAHAQAAWNPNSFNYVVGDLVTYNGAVYRCITAHTSQAGWTPTAAPSLWALHTGGATNTPTRVATRTNTPGTVPTNTRTPTRTNTPTSGGCTYPAYVHGNVYTMGTRVAYNTRHWEAKWWTQNEFPSTGGTGVWRDLGACPGSVTSVPTQGPCSGFSCIVNEAQFNAMFPNRNVSFYTYQGLVDSLSAHPAFATTGTTEIRKREVAAFLAHVDHETWGLYYIRECDGCQTNPYCAASAEFPCIAGQLYYGRGPLQLSWNYNYKNASNYLGMGDQLLNNPDMVAQNGALAWKTALWFWMTQTTAAGTIIPHNAIVNSNGFGETIRTINGIECNGGNLGQMQSRVNKFTEYANLLGTATGSNLTC